MLAESRRQAGDAGHGGVEDRLAVAPDPRAGRRDGSAELEVARDARRRRASPSDAARGCTRTPCPRTPPATCAGHDCSSVERAAVALGPVGEEGRDADRDRVGQAVRPRGADPVLDDALAHAAEAGGRLRRAAAHAGVAVAEVPVRVVAGRGTRTRSGRPAVVRGRGGPRPSAGTMSKIVLSKSSCGPAALGALMLASSTEVSVSVNRGCFDQRDGAGVVVHRREVAHAADDGALGELADRAVAVGPVVGVLRGRGRGGEGRQRRRSRRASGRGAARRRGVISSPSETGK